MYLDLEQAQGYLIYVYLYLCTNRATTQGRSSINPLVLRLECELHIDASKRFKLPARHCKLLNYLE